MDKFIYYAVVILTVISGILCADNGTEPVGSPQPISESNPYGQAAGVAILVIILIGDILVILFDKAKHVHDETISFRESVQSSGGSSERDQFDEITDWVEAEESRRR